MKRKKTVGFILWSGLHSNDFALVWKHFGLAKNASWQVEDCYGSTVMCVDYSGELLKWPEIYGKLKT